MQVRTTGFPLLRAPGRKDAQNQNEIWINSLVTKPTQDLKGNHTKDLSGAEEAPCGERQLTGLGFRC